LIAAAFRLRRKAFQAPHLLTVQHERERSFAVTTTARRIMIVTGEASGDLLGANLITAVRQSAPDIGFFGAGGPRMAAAGCGIVIPGEALSVMGFAEIVGHLPSLWRSFRRLKGELWSSRKPDALVLIDFPDFNLRLARQAKQAGVPVLYYVSPQVWAWRRGRVRKIARVVDSLAAIFPFEPAYYDNLDIRVEYVGHPLLDEFAGHAAHGDLRQKLQLRAGGKLVGLFPGSRRSELRYMLETLVAAAELILAGQPDTHFLVPVAGTLKKEDIQAKFPQAFPVSLIEAAEASIYTVAGSCDAILSVSGTVTLQVALAGTPMAILYKMSPVSFAIAKRLVRVDHVGLPNIVAGQRIVPEFIQDQATPHVLADEVLHVLTDDRYAESIKEALRKVRVGLGAPGCSARVADMLLDMLGRHQASRNPEIHDQ
jgi:lipid-A-disaccharide synthase